MIHLKSPDHLDQYIFELFDISVVKWFKGLVNKDRMRFIEFDIKSYYPSITRDLLNNALDWVSTMVDISEEDRDLIMHTRKSILVNGSDTWIKRGEDLFDVTMGANDGAEVCDIVGLYLLSQLNHLPINGGLYRDDALFACSLPPKQVHKTMEDKCNTTVANFLDVTFDLSSGNYSLF